MFYRKKPVVIDAVPAGDILNYIDGGGPIQEWIMDAVETETVMYFGGKLHIKTLEGTMAAGYEDMIIRGVKGEIYPCKPDIFAATYEPFISGS